MIGKCMLEEDRVKLVAKLQACKPNMLHKKISSLELEYGETGRLLIFKSVIDTCRESISCNKNLLATANGIITDMVKHIKLYLIPTSSLYDEKLASIVIQHIKNRSVPKHLLDKVRNNKYEPTIQDNQLPVNTHIKCRKCGSGVHLTTKQTRALDEGETAFYTCVNHRCRHHWRK